MIAPYYLAMMASYLAIMAVSFYAFLMWREEQSADRVTKYFGMFGGLFSLVAIINFLWAFAFITPLQKDTLFINGLFSVIASVLTLAIVYNLTLNNHLFYILLLFGLTLLALPYSISNFFVSVLLVSNLLFLIVSLDVLIVRRYHIQLVGLAGTIYSLLSLGLTVLLFLGYDYNKLWWFVPNLALAVMILLLHFDKKYYIQLTSRMTDRQKPHVKKVIFGLNFIRYTLYIMAVTAFTFVATVSVHELGHSLAAYYYGCEHTQITYDLKSPPYTEISCASASGTSTFLITLMGLALTLVSSLVFYFAESRFTTKLAALMLGFSLMIFYKDFQDLGASESMETLLLLGSFLVVIIAIVDFSFFYINEHSQTIIPAEKGHPYKLELGKSGVKQ